MSEDHVRVAVIGAGFGGVGLAIKMQDAGYSDFALLERADAVGGTWLHNTYPGCACDIPSHLYSYSFAQKPDWKRSYGDQPEILEYIQGVAAEHGVEEYIRFGTEVISADWDDARGLWAIDTSTGPLTASILVSATGPFGDPVVPDIPGLAKFKGTSFHSLHWDHDHDLTGERVAVIGTGPSAIQFVPEIQPDVGRMFVFQRQAPWIMPRMDRSTSEIERTILKLFPPLRLALRAGTYAAIESLGLVIFVNKRFSAAFEAIGRWQLRRQVKDPELREKLTPDYTIGCKRAILSDKWLPALQQDNVEVVTDHVAEVRAKSVVTTSGDEIPVDTIIFGTGFDVPPMAGTRVHGRDGRSVIDLYLERPQSYLGTTIAGFPNFFMLLGPFAGAGNQSAIYSMESQMNYVVDALRTMDERGAGVVEVKPEAQEAFVAEAEARSADTVWLQGGCTSYYQTSDGRNSGLWPSWSFEFRHRTRRFDEEQYELSPAPDRVRAAA